MVQYFLQDLLPGRAVCVTAGVDAQEAAGSYVQAQGK